MDVLPVTLLIAGIVLVYSGVKNKNPVGVVQAALSGKSLDAVAPLQTAQTSTPGVIPGSQLPGTPGADGDARTDPPGFNPNNPNQGVIPVLPGEGGQSRGNGAV